MEGARTKHHNMTMGFTILSVVFAVIWIGWRVSSKRALLPCPSELAWLVEIENPLARATHSVEVIRRLAVRPGSRVIDVGCGPGRVAIPMAEAVGAQGEVVALDVQPEMLSRVRAKAAQHHLTNLRLSRMDGNRDEIAVAESDATVMIMMVGEVSHPERLLAAVSAALKPDGKLLIAESVFDPHYVRREKLRVLVEAAGFSQVSVAGNLFGYNAIFEKQGRAKQ